MNGREAEMEDIAPGETKSATWLITQPGVYQLACHLPGHFEAGMLARFTVTAAAGARVAQGQAVPLQLAAPSAENQAEHEDQPAAGAATAAPLPTPATLPVTGAAGDISAFGWLAAGIVGLIAAIMGAFRLIVHELRRQQ
jgi:hypothetical protein